MNEGRPVSISDLRTSKLEEVNISDLKAPREQENPNEKFIGDVFGKVDAAMSRIEKEATEFAAKVEEEEIEEKIEKELESEDMDEELDFATEEEPKTEAKSISVFKIDEEDDIDDEDEEEDSKEESDRQMSEMKSRIKEKIKPIANVIDLSTFTISNKPVAVSNIMKSSQSSKHISDWVFPAEGRAISIEEFTGLELEKLNPANSSRNRINTYKDIYNLIYSHIVDASKPATMEQWVKKLNFFDQDHLYFAIYLASFKDSNFIPYSCPHCKTVFVSEDVKMEDMVKYKNEKIEAKMKDLLNKDTTTESESYPVELVQVSDSYVIGLKDPSVYNMIFENVLLDEKFTTKYSELLSVVTFIDSVYSIDAEHSELRPIDVKLYPENIVKSIKSKISTYSKVIQTLNSDQFYQFNAYIKAVQEKHDEITYILPKAKCTNVKCGKDIEEAVMSAESLLFTRHQLAGIANI